MLKKENTKGFTLIETAIVITILSLVIVPLFKFISQERNKHTQIEEENKLERITSAIASYVKQNDGYPCPAIPTIAVGNSNFGAEKTPCTAGSNVTLNAGVIKGSLPSGALRLPYHLTVNRYGWKYMYAVTLARVGAGNAAGIGAIQINDGGGTPVIATKTFKFVVIDPGRDGKGSYSASGGSNGFQLFNFTALDADNCDNDAVFTDTGLQKQNDLNDVNYYDDRIAYTFAREESTMWQITDSVNWVDRNGNAVQDPGEETNSTMDIIPRMDAAIGVGTNVPDKKLQVGDNFSSGDMNIRSGNLMADDSVYSTSDVTATDVTATGQAISPVFYYD